MKKYTSASVENNIAIMQALSDIEFWDKMKILMPQVAKELRNSGVIFPKSTRPAPSSTEKERI